MKFAEHLSAHITPEWRKQYITYEACIRRMFETKTKGRPHSTVQSVFRASLKIMGRCVGHIIMRGQYFTKLARWH